MYTLPKFSESLPVRQKHAASSWIGKQISVSAGDLSWPPLLPTTLSLCTSASCETRGQHLDSAWGALGVPTCEREEERGDTG